MEQLVNLILVTIPAEIIGIAVIQKIKPMLSKKWLVNILSIFILGLLGFFVTFFMFKHNIYESILAIFITIGGGEVIYQQLNLKSLQEIKKEEQEEIIEIER